MTKPVTNFAASARARLLDLTKRRRGDYQLTLQRYVAERFLYRLGVSRHRDAFVLKGAMLFILWNDTAIRPTWDLDLAGYWANDEASLAEAFREICSVPYLQDGLEFALDTMETVPIRDAADEHGFRITVDVLLAGARIPFQVDVGFGDAVYPKPVEVHYPALLDADAPRIFVYPREAVVAEKLHAMVHHGQANSRYKDFFDVHAISALFAFAGVTLAGAISATFSQRQSAMLSPWPGTLTPRFYSEVPRGARWLHYLKRSKLEDAPTDFRILGERVIAFLEQPVRAVSEQRVFDSHWAPGGPWR